MDESSSSKTRKVDLRVKKTKRLIRNAVAALLKEKDVDDITVKEVAELADINRKTFYNYYSNVGQVVNEIENEIVENLDELIQNSDLNNVLQNPTSVFNSVIEVMGRDPELYECIFSMNGNANLVTKIADEIKQRSRDHYASQTNVNGERLDIILEYLFNGMFSAFRRWYSSDHELSLEEVSEDISIACVQGISGFVKK